MTSCLQPVRRWWRNSRAKIRWRRLGQNVRGFRERCQRFSRGWADIDALDFQDWFTATVPEMLDFLANEYGKKPAEYMSPEWQGKVYDLANDLRLMRWANAQEICRYITDERTGELVPDDDDVARIIDEHTERFFRKFRELYWGLYD